MVCPCARAPQPFVDLWTIHAITSLLGGTGRGTGAASPGAVPPPDPAGAWQHQVEASPFAMVTKHTARFITTF